MSGDLAVPLIIGIAPSEAERRHLAELLGGTEAFLIVASVEQAREILDAAVPRTTTDATSKTDLSVDSDRRVLRWLDREVELTRLEHDFMHRLLDAPGQVFTYERLHQEVWGNQHLGRGSDIHSVVRRIRRKLAELGSAATIHSVRGVGFRLTAA
ncbi:winged helix-turn-helix domain-containing protein [Phytohabitans sp. LJ34]|uniref:winged helix-turn-helix domain-containing protein n=1 Tax=Phytohabitans sp. LJ34 TaxID=3452217 RepID=UPI003F8CD7BB